MRIKQIVKDAPKMLAEFYGITVKEAKEKIEIGPELVKEEWEEYGVDYDEFYQKVKSYPFDLAKFSNVYRLTYLKGVFEYATSPNVPYIENIFDEDRKLKLLEIGSGGGELALALSDMFDVTCVDVPGTTFDYAKFRAEKYGLDIRFLNEIPDEKFDIVSAQDVMEHVTNLDALLTAIGKALTVGGLLLSSALWFNSNHYLHLDKYTLLRDTFIVDFGSLFDLWLNQVLICDGIKDTEPSGSVGIFRYLPSLTEGLNIGNVLMSRVDARIPASIPSIEGITRAEKIQYLLTIT
jgi:SAM-dependent methyltransferase